MCYSVLSANALESEVLLCTELVEGWQEHVLMIYNLDVETVVLLVYGIDASHVDCAFIS